MQEKVVVFDSFGGTEKVLLNVNSSSLPIEYNIESSSNDWISVSIINDNVLITVPSTYNFNDRQGKIFLRNARNNELCISVKQHGYHNLEIKTDKEVIIKDLYYNDNEFYNMPVTVYGGPTQMLKCAQLQDNIIKVWDNSDLYNEFIIKIPKTLSGIYTLKHSDYTKYKKYCDDNNIEFDDTKLKTSINIQHVSMSNLIGELVIEYNGNTYKSGDIVPVDVLTENKIKIISGTFLKIDKNGDYKTVNNKTVDYDYCPEWLSINIDNEIVDIQPIKNNGLDLKSCDIKLYNTMNEQQSITLRVQQKSTAN